MNPLYTVCVPVSALPARSVKSPSWPMKDIPPWMLRISLAFGALDLMLPIIPLKLIQKLGYDMPYALSHADTKPIHRCCIIDGSIRLSTLTQCLPKSNHSKVILVPKFLSPNFFTYNRSRPKLKQEYCYKSLLRMSAFQITSLLTALNNKQVQTAH